jgi:hypothetical protein
MAYFYALRGWVELDREGFEQAVSILTQWSQQEMSEKNLLYLQGWCWNHTPINWQRYLFYGADVTEEGIELLKQVLTAFQTENIELSGYFQVTGEDSKNHREIII